MTIDDYTSTRLPKLLFVYTLHTEMEVNHIFVPHILVHLRLSIELAKRFPLNKCEILNALKFPLITKEFLAKWYRFGAIALYSPYIVVVVVGLKLKSLNFRFCPVMQL